VGPLPHDFAAGTEPNSTSDRVLFPNDHFDGGFCRDCRLVNHAPGGGHDHDDIAIIVVVIVVVILAF